MKMTIKLSTKQLVDIAVAQTIPTIFFLNLVIFLSLIDESGL